MIFNGRHLRAQNRCCANIKRTGRTPFFSVIRIVVFLHSQAADQTDEHARQAEDEHHQRGARALARAKQRCPERRSGVLCHEWLAYVIHEQTAEEESDRYGEELEGIAAREHAPLQLHRHG